MKRSPRFPEHGETFQGGGSLIGMGKHRQVRRRAQRQRPPKKPTLPRWKREPIEAWCDRMGRALGISALLRWVDRACGVR